MFEGVDWELRWPRELFVEEANKLIARIPRPIWSKQERPPGIAGLFGTYASPPSTELVDSMYRLLEEAFVGMVVAVAPEAGLSAYPPPLLERIVELSSELRLAEVRQPYYSKRQLAAQTEGIGRWVAEEAFIELVEELYIAGFFDEQMPKECVEDKREAIDPSRVLSHRLGYGPLWPLRRSHGEWAATVFFDLVEVFHDLISRGRSRRHHEQCGWHYEDFVRETGQRLYRFRVNRILEHYAIPYRLAEAGEDRGRLVSAPDPARAELLDEMASRADERTGAAVRHAIALFRDRNAAPEKVRLAVLGLVRVLEDRRELLEGALLHDDSAALFQIANRFDLRHSGAHQRTESR